jgi:biopolymer transport protein ExbD
MAVMVGLPVYAEPPAAERLAQIAAATQREVPWVVQVAPLDAGGAGQVIVLKADGRLETHDVGLVGRLTSGEPATRGRGRPSTVSVQWRGDQFQIGEKTVDREQLAEQLHQAVRQLAGNQVDVSLAPTGKTRIGEVLDALVIARRALPAPAQNELPRVIQLAMTGLGGVPTPPAAWSEVLESIVAAQDRDLILVFDGGATYTDLVQLLVGLVGRGVWRIAVLARDAQGLGVVCCNLPVDRGIDPGQFRRK